MRKYLILLLFILCFIPSIVKIEEEKKRIETKKIEMDQYAEEWISTPLFGILEIPSISLKQPIYQKDREENQVDKNVTLLEETFSKKEKNSVIVLASHSGSGIHSYFKNLSILKPNAKIYFYYQNSKIVYQLFKKEEVIKNGTITFDYYEFPTIILITCSKTKENIQEVYYAKYIENAKIS